MVAVGVVVLVAGIAVAAVVGLNSDATDSTGSGGTAVRESVASNEVVVPLNLGKGVALYALDQEGNVDPLREPSPGMALGSPSLSPDRRFVYFRELMDDDVTEFTTKVLDLESGEVSAMVDATGGLECVGRPAWRPGSTTVAVLCREGGVNIILEGEQEQGEGGRITDLEPIPDLATRWANVAYLGTGELVVTQRPNGERPGIYVGPSDDVQRLVAGQIGATAASPSDNVILYEQAGVIWSVRADGSEPPCPGGTLTPDSVTSALRCRLTDGGAGVDLGPAWEEVGENQRPERFVFVRSDDPDEVEGELLVYDLAGGGEPQPFSQAVNEVSGWPAWAHR